ncbi:MAG: hypothetical protein AAF384_09465 [Pseudomonadota bacterium]
MAEIVPVEMPAWERAEFSEYRLESGFAYPTKEVVIEASEQQRLHQCCGITADIFQNQVDPALLSRLPIVMLSNTIVATMPGWGQVHIVHHIEQHRPIRLGERLIMAGTVAEPLEHPRGFVAMSNWIYRDEAGDIAFEVRPEVLLLDAARATAAKPSSKSGGAPIDALAYEDVGEKVCTPATTVRYCEGTYNRVHDDIKVAKKLGFRAPIIAGTQTMNFLMEPIFSHSKAPRISLRIRFMRPVFWDDTLVIQAARSSGVFKCVRAMNAQKKCVADCAIEFLKQ